MTSKTERELKLEAALQFYARHKTWNAEPYEVAPAIIDAGRNARKALADEDAGGGECPTCGGSGLLDGYDPDDPPMPGCAEPCPDCDPDATPPQRQCVLEAWERMLKREEDAADRDLIGSVLAQIGQEGTYVQEGPPPGPPMTPAEIQYWRERESLTKVLDEIRALPKQWRKMLNRTDAGYYSMTVCADDLDSVLAQSGEAT